MIAAFLLSSVFKPALPESPIDISVLFFIVSVLMGVNRVIKKPKINRRFLTPITLFIAFTGILVFSLLYTPSKVYSMQKILIFLSFTTWSFIGPFLLIDNKDSLKKFLMSFVIISFITSIYVLIDYFTSDAIAYMRVGVNGENSLGLGRMAAMGSIIIIMIFLFNSKVDKKNRIYSLFALLILLLTLLLSGSRMSLISLILLVVVFLFIKTFRFTKGDILLNKRSTKVALSLIPIPLLLIPFKDSLQTILVRLTQLFDSSGVGSYSLRTELFSLAIGIWENNPLFGDGFGSYGLHYHGFDSAYYPHNIFLEILAEVGLVGFILFCIFLIVPFIKNNIFESNYIQITVLLLFLYMLLNANTTGDINDNRMMFTFLSLMYMYPYFDGKSLKKSYKDDNLLLTDGKLELGR